jgi:M6 family metalloprotease-like protein
MSHVRRTSCHLRFTDPFLRAARRVAVLAVLALAAAVAPGRAPLVGSAVAASGASVRASFISERGWVRPGETYPFKVDYAAGSGGADSAVVRIVLHPSSSFLTSTPAPTSGDGSAGSPLTYNLGALPAGQGGRIVVQARAKTLAEDPEVLWKAIPAEAALATTVGGVPQAPLTSSTNGPRVTTHETARYGDRPFPMINVEYQDLKRCTGVVLDEVPENCEERHTAEGLDRAVNSRTSGTSIWQLYQDISLGQLNPIGAVPAAGRGTVPFDGIGEHRFSQFQPQGVCTGATIAGTDGTPAYANRIQDGWYQLPGTQAYYGADRFGSNFAAALGVGVLAGIDDACGPTGKLVYDAASLADPDLDYNDFDGDRNGVVDFFMAVFAGTGGNVLVTETSANNVWPHSSDLRFYFTDENGQTGYVSNDQLRDQVERPLWWTDETRSEMTTQDTGDDLKVYVRVGPYNVNPETAIDTISVIAHEYGHSLGLPDFYTISGRQTFGTWELMATDHAQFMTVFARQELGWIVPKEATDGIFGLRESKNDTHEIAWTRPDGSPYALSGPEVHNADAFRVGLPPANPVIEEVTSGTHAWFSGAGNDFGCPTQEGHGLVIQLPEVAQVPGGTPISLSFSSFYEIEWDFDYGFVMASIDGGATWQTLPSRQGTTINRAFNPNAVGCLAQWDNGITGVSRVSPTERNSPANPNRIGSQAGEATYPPAEWMRDEYDLSAFAGETLLIMLSYATDPGLAKRGWFIDDLAVTTPDRTLYSSDFETDQEPLRLFPAGKAGWTRVSTAEGSPADHAYYIELRDRVSWDFDSKGQSDRAGGVTWQPGVSIIYTNEAHGYGNVGVENPPAQTPVDSNPQPGNNFPNLDDAAFVPAEGRDRFNGCTHIDNYTDPDGPGGLWKLPPGLDMVVRSITGLSETGQPPSAAVASVAFDIAPDCARPPELPPVLSFGADRSDPDPDGAFTLMWTRPPGAVGPDQLQEATAFGLLLEDGAEAGTGKWIVTTSGAGAFAWEPSPLKVQSGENAFWARGLEGATNAESIMTTSQPIAVPARGKTLLTFYDWFVTESDDLLFVEVNDGTGWVSLRTTNRALIADEATVAFADEGLSKNTIDLTPYGGKSIHLRFRYTLGPDNRPGSTPTYGWFVDDIAVDTADWSDVATVAGTSHRRTGLANGTYFYRVRTAYPLGDAATVESPWSNVVSTAVERVPMPDLQVTDVTTSRGTRANEGEKLTLSATISNVGDAAAAPSATRFLLDGSTLLGLAGTPSVPAGGSVVVSAAWDTRGLKGEHVVEVTADSGGAVAESDEANNAGLFTATIQGNKVKNGSFEQSSTGSSPDGWSGSGSATYGSGGGDGERSVQAGGTGSWTSDPIAVEAGRTYSTSVDVSGAGGTFVIEQMSATGAVLGTLAQVLSVADDGLYHTVTQSISVAGGVTQVRIRLAGSLLGVTRFDNVGMWEE